jgi:hypothetical protein
MSGLTTVTGGRQSLAVGSLEWAQNEIAIARSLAYDNIEDFAYAARRDLEWLNEHMADVTKWDQG